MSVPKSKRKDSKVQFLQTQLDLMLKTIEVCKRLPKAVTFYISIPTTNAARDAYHHARVGNSIFPKTKADLDERISEFEKSRRALQVLSTEMDIAYEYNGGTIKEGTAVEWFRLLCDANNLITAQIKNDKSRFSNLD